MPAIKAMDHFTVLSDRLEETRAFYERLGLTNGPRPEFEVPGLWLYAGETPILHVIGVDRMPEPRGGAIDHMAFAASGLQDTLDLLKAAGVACQIVRTPRPYSYWQVFCDDPNGAKVELTFPADEPRPLEPGTRS
ncbi:MAG: dioxygenase [Caulobacter sp.]|nr:dioxygenase [Caulobacter sp.]